ncbi:hypothetical protein M8J76_009074 [Diaphorina citri]|nr:hypothetical protein M8J75_015789 [Diaphorina citri]KAI5719361.1 hypothetical protein M8J76_009074 [Diaphorina citri]KAI5720844.1 hypothetical protein M8J77_012370 [Diaphorina citri]
MTLSRLSQSNELLQWIFIAASIAAESTGALRTIPSSLKELHHTIGMEHQCSGVPQGWIKRPSKEQPATIYEQTISKQVANHVVLVARYKP